MKDNRIPSYYIGSRYKIEARKVIEDFDLSYNVGTACTYLMRANRKHDSPIECIQKAINHLEFELDKLKTEPSLSKRRDNLWSGAKEKLVGERGINESFD